MGDKYDQLAQSLGVPPSMLPWWRARAGADTPAPAAAPPPSAPIRPGDPGWNITGVTPPPGGTVGLPSPPGPRPGEAGFDITKMPNEPAPVPRVEARPPPMTKPEKPKTLAEQAKAANASIDRTVAERQPGVADLTKLSPKKVAQIMADQKASEENANKVDMAAKDKQRLADATFDDGAGGAGAGGPPVMVSPGGRTPHSWTTQTQEGVKLSPDTKAYAEGAEVSKVDAAGMHLDADERAAAGELSLLRRHELVQQARETELRDRAERQRQQYETSLSKLNDMTDAVQSDRIDPEQWKMTRSAGQKFAAGLAIALGAVSSAMLRSGVNPGLEMVRESIHDEIDAQKSNAQLRRAKLEDQRSLLGQMAKTFGDERVAEDATWILYLERAKTKLAAQQAESKSDYAKARYADAITQIKEEIAGRREKWDQLEQDRITRVQNDVNAPPTYAGAGAGGPLSKRDREEASDTSKELVKAAIPQQLATLQNIDRSIDTFGTGAIPGVGPIKSHIPDVAYGLVNDDRAVAARQAFQSLKLQVQHEIAGASLTSGEKAELDVLTKGAYDAASLRRVVHAFRSKLSGTARVIGAGASDAARTELTRRYNAIPGERGAPYNVPVTKPSAPYVKPPE